MTLVGELESLLMALTMRLSGPAVLVRGTYPYEYGTLRSEAACLLLAGRARTPLAGPADGAIRLVAPKHQHALLRSSSDSCLVQTACSEVKRRPCSFRNIR